MATIATLTVKVLGDASDLKSNMASATQDMKRNIDAMKSFGTAMTAGVTLPILGIGAAAIKSAAEQEQLQIAFTTMLGSADKANKLIQDLQTFSAATPFEMPEVVTAGKQLLAFGIAAEDIQPTLTMLGDVASGIGAPVGDLAYLFGTASASGRLMTADINQFSNRGIPMIKALAASMGVAESSIRGMAEKGMISSEDMVKAFQYMTKEGSQFGGMMEKQSASINGMMSTLKDNIGQTLTAVGVQLIKILNLGGADGLMAKFLAMTNMIKDGIVGFTESFPNVSKIIIIFTGIVAAMGPVIGALGIIAGMVGEGGTLALGFGVASQAIGATLTVLLGPIGLVIAAVGLLTYAIVNDWGGLGTFLGRVFGTIVNVLEGFYDVIVYGEDAFSDFTAFFEQLEPLVGTQAAQAIGTFGQSLMTFRETAEAVFIGLWDIIGYGQDPMADFATWFQQLVPLVGGDAAYAIVEFGEGLLAVRGYLVEVAASGNLMNQWFLQLPAAIQPAVLWLSNLQNAVTQLAGGQDFATLQTNITAAMVDIGAAVHDYFSGDISLGGLAGAVSQGFADIGSAISSFFGGADFGTFLSDIQWSEFIEKLTWENFLTVMHWEDFVTMLGDWGQWIAALDWKSIITTTIDWATWIPALTWTAIIALLDWNVYLAPIVWDSFISLLNWADATGEKINWSSFISVLTWDNFITALSWAAYIASITWSSFVDHLEWTGAIARLESWGDYISKVDWTAFIVQLLDWATWVPALAWNNIIETINWVDYIANLIWGDSVKPLTWSEFVPAMFAWGEYVFTLVWSQFVPAAFSWASYVFALVWSQFVPAAFSWASYVFALTWSNFVDKLNWPSITWPGWSAFVPSFPGWPNIGQMISDMIPDIPGLGGNALGTDNWKGGFSWVGEAGPELVYLPRGSAVDSASKSKRRGGDEGMINVGPVYVQNEMDAVTLAYKLDDLRKRRERR